MMFEAIRARLRNIQRVPMRARELVAERLTAAMPKGHAVESPDGVICTTAPRRKWVGDRWAAIIVGSIADAMKEGQ